MKKIFFALFVFSIIFCNQASTADALLLLPVDDGTIFDFGNDGTVDYINSVESVQAANGSRGLIEFDISSLSSPASDAFVRLYKNASLGEFPFQVDLYAYSGDGVLGADDYFAGTLVTSFNYNDESMLDINLTDTVNDAVLNAYNFLGLNLVKYEQFPSAPSLSYISFGSLEYPKDGSKPAELHATLSETNVVPEPASILLFASGLAGAFVRKKFKA